MSTSRDDDYRELLLAPLLTSALYLPKMGGADAVDFHGFQELYGVDPFYHWMGLDTELMYAAHKAAGGMTSVYRQLGIGAERLFRALLKDQLGLSASQVVWSYTVVEESTTGGSARSHTLTLDGRAEMSEIVDAAARARVGEWVAAQAARLDITIPLHGAVFEVRQGYKSADSKRQNADIANATQALGHGYLPVLAVMSTQINAVVHERYNANNWAVLLGHTSDDPISSTFAFSKQVLGYDLVAFFERNTELLRAQLVDVLAALLEAK